MSWIEYTDRRRKAFKESTKKKVWLKAAGKSPDSTWSPDIRAKCMKLRCPYKATFRWGDGAYSFDHKDNNPANNKVD